MIRGDCGEEANLLSVVIIGKNEASRIVKCIQSVKTAVASVPDCEIVYIDSVSDDCTGELAFSQGIKTYRIANALTQSPAAGRYIGSQVTHGRYILFVDGDSIIANGWIQPALRLMQSNSDNVMFSGQLNTAPGYAGDTFLQDVRDIGEIQLAGYIGGGKAPIIERAALEISGNWNPFVRSREEEDLAIRMQIKNPKARILQSDQITAWSPVYSLTIREFVRRWKRGFHKGPGQIFRNAITQGYWRRCIHIMQSAILAMSFVVGLFVSFLFHVTWQFVLFFFVIALLRAILKRKLIRVVTVYYSLFTGISSLWEFFTVPVRTGDNYIYDIEEISSARTTNCNEQAEKG